MDNNSPDSKAFERHVLLGADILHLETYCLALDLERKAELINTIIDCNNLLESYHEYFSYSKKLPESPSGNS